MSFAPRGLLTAAAAALCLAAPAAQAQAPSPAPPFLTYTPSQQGTYNGLPDIFDLTLFGYQYPPGTLPAVGSPEYVSHSVFALYEADYENAAINAFPIGTPRPQGTGPDDWVFVTDVAFHGGPESPNDPTVFTLTAPVGINIRTQQEDHLYDQNFYLYNYVPVINGPKSDALLQSLNPVAVVRPILAPAAVPESSSLALLGLGVLALAGVAARRRPAA